jgi:hypothetical protein
LYALALDIVLTFTPNALTTVVNPVPAAPAYGGVTSIPDADVTVWLILLAGLIVAEEIVA